MLKNFGRLVEMFTSELTNPILAVFKKKENNPGSNIKIQDF